MGIKKSTDEERINHQSLIKSGKIALLYFAFGAAWILVTDSLAQVLFGNLNDVVYFSIIKGLVYVLLSALLILCLVYSNIKQIFQKEATELKDKQYIEKQRSLLNTLVNATPDLVFYKDSECRYVGCNKAFEEFVGLTRAEIVGKTDYDLFDPESAESFRRIDLKVISSAKSIKNEEQVTYPDGYKVWLDTNKSPFYDSDNTLAGLVGVSRDISDKKAFIFQLEKEKKLFETFINSTQNLIYLKDDDFRHIIVNKAFADFWNKDMDELIGKFDYELMSPELAKHALETDQEVVRNNKALSYIAEVNDRIFEVRKFPVLLNHDSIGVGSFIRDITTRYKQQEIISRVSETNRIIAQCMLKQFEDIKEQFDYALNEALKLTESQFGCIYLFDEDKKEFTLSSWTEMAMDDCAVIGKLTDHQLEKTQIWDEIVRQRKPIVINDFDMQNPLEKFYSGSLAGIQRFMSLPVFENDKIVAVIGFANKKTDYSDNDVQAIALLMSGVWIATRRKEKEKENEYMAYHDYLTGLYNRRFYEEEFARKNSRDDDGYPIAILMGDINGLKMYNDTYGHIEGDKAILDIVHKMQEYAGSEDVVARIGGDEFVIIKCNTNREEMEEYLRGIDNHVNLEDEDRERDRLTISFGYSIQRKKDDSLDELMKEAEAFMYNRKYYSSRSTRSNTVNVIMDALFTKSEREKEHSERVGLISKLIADKMQLNRHLIDQIKIAGFLHDIGKIGINEKILNKFGKLDDDEWKIMKMHSAKGAKILENTVEYFDIADIVLCHHEHFDGSGYPKGLEEKEIPLLSRIIAVACC